MNWNDVLAIFRKLWPEHKFLDDFKENPRMKGKLDDMLEKRLLKEWAGRDEYIQLEQGIKDAFAGPGPWSGKV
jgi:hypothetical protein